MALEDKIKEKDEAPKGNLTDEEEQDLKIAVLLGEKMIDEGGIDVINQAIQESSDPSQVIGQFLMQLGSQMHESMPEDMQLSKKVFLCEGGWVEQISDFLQEEHGIKKSVMDRAEIYIASSAQQMAQGAQQTGESAVPGQQQPPMPGPAPAAPSPQEGMPNG